MIYEYASTFRETRGPSGLLSWLVYRSDPTRTGFMEIKRSIDLLLACRQIYYEAAKFYSGPLFIEVAKRTPWHDLMWYL